jgi:hypothetical protein
MVTRGANRSADSSQLEGHWEEDGKIIVGIDIGTTQSGVALACLEKGTCETTYPIFECDFMVENRREKSRTSHRKLARSRSS